MSSVKFWQNRLAEIYPNNNVSPDYIMAHLYTATSEICRLLLRGEDGPASDKYVIRSITWIIALANHFDVDYEDHLVRRYPNICTYCLSIPCRCDATGKLPLTPEGRRISDSRVEEELDAKYRVTKSSLELNFDRILKLVNNIYPGNRTLIKKHGQAYVASKMLEEGGEIHRSYSLYLKGDGKIKHVGVELADLSGWVLSCWDIEHGTASLDAAMANMFLEGCPTCKVNVCTCPAYSITRDQEETIRSVIQLLRALQNIGIQDNSIQDAVIAAESAAADPTSLKKKNLISKLKSVLSSAKEVNQGVDGTVGIVNKLSDSVEFLSALV